MKKTYGISYNVGKAKYVVSYHDGEKKHKDGSPFFDLSLFKSKKALSDFVGKLKKDGYTQA